jgi:hypothetical protein
MKLTRSDSPEVANSIASTGVLACWGWSLLTLVCIASAPGLMIALIASLTVSVRTAVWLGVPIIIALNGYLLWRGRSPHLNWVMAGCTDRVFVRLFVRRGWGQSEKQEPDVIVLESSEIASISIRTVEVFLYGPKPRIVEWLVIKLSQPVADCLFDQISRLLNADNPGKQVCVTNEEGCLTMNWEWCRPFLREFLQQVGRECPSLTIAPEERSELDLNGVWHGVRGGPDAQQRRMLVKAKRLGFSCECERLLSLYRRIPRGEVSAYMAEIEQEETGIDHSVECSSCRF